MDLDQSVSALWSNTEKLRQENETLKATLATSMSHLTENVYLRASLQNFNCTSEELTGVLGVKPSFQCQQTLDEKQFQNDLQQNNIQLEHRTSSPVNFQSFLQSSMHTDAKEQAEEQTKQNKSRMLGEIAYQLDRRILFHVFQGQKRLYGFTVLNIPDKIIEVSTHPLTGKVDKGYQFYLFQRYSDLMTTLQGLGFKAALHPPFSEFIVNTYGILKDRPNGGNDLEVKFNNPDFLKGIVTTTAPKQLQKDLQLLLTCLCHMAEKDRKPLCVW